MGCFDCFLANFVCCFLFVVDCRSLMYVALDYV